MNIAKRTLAEPYQSLDVFKILERNMVVIPKNKIHLIGKPGITLNEKASVCLSIQIENELVCPVLHLCGADLAVNPTMIELDSVAPHILEAPITLSSDVLKHKPKDAIIVNDKPANMDELKNVLAEIAFVRSIRLLQIQLTEPHTADNTISCIVTLGKRGSVSLRRELYFSESLNELLGEFFESKS